MNRSNKNFRREFFRMIDIRGDDDCWNFRGSVTPAGYGYLQVDGKTVPAHRISYEIYNEEIPDGLFVLHSCDNPPCCNPRHLRVGTSADNARDRVNRGRDNSKLSYAKAEEIRALYDSGGKSCAQIGKMFGVCPGTIYAAVSGLTWKKPKP